MRIEREPTDTLKLFEFGRQGVYHRIEEIAKYGLQEGFSDSEIAELGELAKQYQRYGEHIELIRSKR